MKRYLKIFAVICGLIVCGMDSPVYGQYLLSTGVRYDTFFDDRSPETKGFELTFPLGVAYKQKQYSISVETAYISATVNSSDESDVTLSSFTDTLFSVAYTYTFPNLPMGIIFGLDANLPSGKERLSERESIAEAGESNDLFEVDNFGDGTNVGLSLGLVSDIGNLNLGIQGAYIINGGFDPTRDTPDDDLNPGDQILALALFGWRASSRLMLDTFVAYSHFFRDTVDGQENFRAGDNVVVGGNFRYERKSLGIVLSLQGTVQGKNEELAQGKFQTEPENSNGYDFFGLVDVTYRPFSKFTLRVLGDIRYYGESDLKNELSGLPFESERVRYAIGPGFMYSLGEHLSFDGLLKFFLMTQEPDITSDQEVTFQGINFDVGFTYMF
jgi:hypothetical protein